MYTTPDTLQVDKNRVVGIYSDDKRCIFAQMEKQFIAFNPGERE